MKLSTKNVSGPQGEFYREGFLYVRKAQITGLSVAYAAQNRFGRERDVIMHVKLRRDDFDIELEIDGNYRRSEDGTITGWGGVFKIALLLETCGISTETDEHGHIPTEALKQLAGKEVATLSVPYQQREDGRYAYYTYNLLMGFINPETGEERPFDEVARDLLSRFYRDNYAHQRYLDTVSEQEQPTQKTVIIPDQGQQLTLPDDDIPF